MKCDYCHGEIHGMKCLRIPYKCHFCGGSFCLKHRLPEYHDCKTAHLHHR
ncbi:AN1-type zinc finger domain-containing protein [Methanomethylovorans sp.]